MLVILSVVQGGPKGARLLFPPGEFVFGRSDECNVVLVHRSASRRHFLLRVSGDGAFVRDLFSRNKTTVNREIVTGERPLQDGDSIYVGGIGIMLAVQLFRGESCVLASDASCPKVLYQHGASPDDQTAALTACETALVRSSPL